MFYHVPANLSSMPLFSYDTAMRQELRRAFIIVFVAVGVVLAVAMRFEQVLAVPVQLTTGALESWGWIGSPVDQAGATEGIQPVSPIGFIQLNCNSAFGKCDTVDGKQPNVTVDTDSGDVSGYGWIGADETDAGVPHSIGWVNFDAPPLDSPAFADPACAALGPAFYYPEEPCHSAQVDTGNKEEVSGWARIESIAEEGDLALGTANHDNDWGWVKLRGNNTADGLEYGVLYRNGTFEGWAWSGGGTTPMMFYDPHIGLGWIDFATGSIGSPTGPAGGYVSTERGDVYVGGGISNPAGVLDPPQFNATYLITSSGGAGSIVNFSSELLGEGNFIDENSDQITLPDADSEFRSELGRLDIDKLTTLVGGGPTNVYGNPVFTVPAVDFLPSLLLMNGIVVVVDDGSATQDHQVQDAVTFANGTNLPTAGFDYDGSGTFIVNGDLTINANMFYEESALLHLDNLASVAWIVRGDLIIGENVTNLVGSFFVIGDDVIGDGISDGKITTLAASAQQLQVYGLMMARSFDFQRSYEGVPGQDEPAELIYYDGRVIANTPPGLEDYASVLPVVQ